MGIETRKKKTLVDATREVRFRLDVQEPGGPFLPRSFHPTYDEAFDAGLLAVTGQIELELEPRTGWDFIVRDAAPKTRR